MTIVEQGEGGQEREGENFFTDYSYIHDYYRKSL
jgi:hypothetical protein